MIPIYVTYAYMTSQFSTHLCVYGVAAPTSAWISQLTKTLPSYSIAVCLLGECAKAQEIPSHWQKLPTVAANGDFHEAIFLCAQLFPGESFILLRSDTILPEYWYERLSRIFNDETILAAGPLDNLDPTRAPLPAADKTDADVGKIDALCFAYSRRTLIDCAVISPLLSAWNGNYIKNINFAESLNLLTLSRAPGRVVMLDHLYVAASAQVLQIPPINSHSTEISPSSALGELHELLSVAFESKDTLETKTAFFGLDNKPVVLHILHSWGGGAEQFVRDFSNADSDCHHLVLIARGHFSRRQYGETLELHRGNLNNPPLRQITLPQPIIDTAIHNSTYEQFLAEIKRDYCIDIIVVSSLIGHSLDVVRTGLPTFIITHDFYPLWPVLHQDFGNPQLAFDDAQLASDLATVEHNFEFASNDPDYWQIVRKVYVAAVTEANATLIAPSRSALANLLRLEPKFQGLPSHTISHGLAPWLKPTKLSLPPARQRLRVIIPGRIRRGKGAELLRTVLPHLRLYADIFLVGCGAEGEQFFGENNVHIVINYQREELPKLASIIAPDIVLLLPTVAETFSYMLSEVWSLGLPVIATRVGSLAERIEHGITGWLVAPNPTEINAATSSIAQSRDLLIQMREEIKRHQAKSLSAMVADYHALLPLAAKPMARYRLHAMTINQIKIANLNTQLGNAKSQISSLQSEINQHLKELAARADWANGLEQEALVKTSWAKELELDLHKTREILSNTEIELENRTQWALSLNEHISAINNRNCELNNQNLELSNKNLELNNRNLDLVSTVEATKGQLKEIQESLNITQESLNIIQKAHQELLSSRSWRITAPLRRATTLYRNLRARTQFTWLRYRSVIGRLRGSLARRGIKATLHRVTDELNRTMPQPTDKLVPFVSVPENTEGLYLPFTLPTSSNPHVSIIIPVYNKFSYTYACLRSLAEHAGNTPFEVIVVDDYSSDETLQKLTKIAGIEFIRNTKNLGFIGSCNAGATIAKGKFIAFLNNDTVVTPGWLESLIRCLEQERNAGLIGAKLVYPDGRLQEAGGIIFSDGSGWNYGRFDNPNDPKYNYRREVDYCSGAAILLRRELFEQLGGFDTRYAPAYYEDTDLAFAVRTAGLKVIYEPASTIVHFEGITSGTDTSTGIKRYQITNQAKFLEKWKDTLLHQPTPGAVIDFAREHHTRGRVLVVDAYTPTPDQDSGSLRMVNFMRILRNLGYAVSFMPENLAYMPNYTPAIQALGVEALYHPYSEPVRWFRENGTSLRYIILSRHYVAANFIGLCRLYAPQAKLIFDTVDLHYLREQRAAELENRTDLKHQATITRANELKIMRECDITLVVSPIEQALIKKELPQIRVEILSNVHEIYGCRKPFSERGDLIFIGGFQHTPNVDAILFFISQVWPLVHPSLPEIKLHIVGSKTPEEILALNGNGITVHGFVEDIAPLMDNCRLSIAPLRYGAGVKGKVNMAMSYGLPVIATSIAVEGMYVRVGEDVMVADKPADFAAAIVEIYQDEFLWKRLSDNGLKNVRKFFSFDAATEAVQRILN